MVVFQILKQQEVEGPENIRLTFVGNKKRFD